jgi:hypothetical protein
MLATCTSATSVLIPVRAAVSAGIFDRLRRLASPAIGAVSRCPSINASSMTLPETPMMSQGNQGLLDPSAFDQLPQPWSSRPCSRVRDRDDIDRQSGERSIAEVASRLGVKADAVYYWAQRGYLPTRRGTNGRRWAKFTADLQTSSRP